MYTRDGCAFLVLRSGKIEKRGHVARSISGMRAHLWCTQWMPVSRVNQIQQHGPLYLYFTLWTDQPPKSWTDQGNSKKGSYVSDATPQGRRLLLLLHLLLFICRSHRRPRRRRRRTSCVTCWVRTWTGCGRWPGPHRSSGTRSTSRMAMLKVTVEWFWKWKNVTLAMLCQIGPWFQNLTF